MESQQEESSLYLSSIRNLTTTTSEYFNDDTTAAAELLEDDEEEQQEITPAELIEKLQQIWLNEKFAPELLEHQSPIVECIIDQIKHMENNINSANKGDFRIVFHKLELDRIKFMLYSYLRARIKKIEHFASAILKEDHDRATNVKSKLSAEEYAYAIEYSKNVKDHLTATVLEHLPPNLQDLNELSIMPRPDMNKFVFFKALESFRGLSVDDTNIGRNEIVDIEKDDIFIMRYRPIQHYVNNCQIQLI